MHERNSVCELDILLEAWILCWEQITFILRLKYHTLTSLAFRIYYIMSVSEQYHGCVQLLKSDLVINIFLKQIAVNASLINISYILISYTFGPCFLCSLKISTNKAVTNYTLVIRYLFLDWYIDNALMQGINILELQKHKYEANYTMWPTDKPLWACL